MFELTAPLVLTVYVNDTTVAGISRRAPRVYEVLVYAGMCEYAHMSMYVLATTTVQRAYTCVN